jgi:hypothetical protein
MITYVLMAQFHVGLICMQSKLVLRYKYCRAKVNIVVPTTIGRLSKYKNLKDKAASNGVLVIFCIYLTFTLPNVCYIHCHRNR